MLAGGDDAALVAPTPGCEIALSVDMLVEGRHFVANVDPQSLGHKTLAVNLSDLAAMGADARWVTLALTLEQADDAWLASFAAGLGELAARHGVSLVGGDTTRGPLSITVTAMGVVPTGSAIRRDGARAGDAVCVTGTLGDAALALRLGAALGLARPDIAAAAARLHQPEPRVELGARLRGLATSAIDVSDGFAQDLGHILERSHAGALVRYADLPRFGPFPDADMERRCVLAGGDDYELVFTAPPVKRSGIEALGAELKLRLSRVGSIQRGEPKLVLLDASGAPMAVPRGYDHFSDGRAA